MRARTHTYSTVKTSSRFFIEYLDNCRGYFSQNGRSLPVKADNQEHAVVMVFGGAADAGSWNGNHFTVFGGRLRARVEEVRR